MKGLLNAIKTGNCALAQEILAEEPALVHERAPDGNSLLHTAINSLQGPGLHSMLEILLRAGVDVNIIGPGSSTALYLAACMNFSCVDLLIDRGALIDGIGDCIPLHAAAAYQPTDAVSHLLDRGANVNATDSIGWTAIHHSYDDLWPRSASYLWDRGCRKDPFAAAAIGKFDYILKHINKSNVNFVDGSYRTPLHWSCVGQQIAVSRLLLEIGADALARDDTGYTPMHHAVRSVGSAELAAVLLKHGAEANARSSRGFTPLHVAAICEDPDTIGLLVAHGAKLDDADDEGLTPRNIMSPEVAEQFE